MTKKLGLFNKIIYWINIVVVLLLLVSFVLPYVPPNKYPTISLLSLAVSPLIILNIIFIIYWVFKLKSKVILSLIVVVFAYFHFGSFFKFSSEKDTEEYINTLKVLSFNVRLFNLYEKKETQINIPEIIKNYIEKEQPDVLCLQEFHKDSRLDFSEFPYQYIYFRKKNVLGHAIFSKFPLMNKYSFDFEKTYNNALCADVVKGKDTIRIYNMHLQSLSVIPSLIYLKETDKDVLRSRMSSRFIEQQEQVATIMNHKKKSKYPVVISGDFNNTPFSYVYHELSKNMYDAFVEAGNGLGTTYFFDSYPMRIDYILTSKELEVLKFETIKETFSDHYPITATIGWD